MYPFTPSIFTQPRRNGPSYLNYNMAKKFTYFATKIEKY